MASIKYKNGDGEWINAGGGGGSSVTVDTEIIAGSNNPVSGGAVYNAISSIPTPDVSGQINAHNSDANAHTDIRSAITSIQIYTYGATAPSNTKLLWNDTNTATGGLKYYNGSAWVHVPVAYS